ncbi:MAG: riboflavin synthase [bacterium]|jgi:riboflavin synthase|nr:MAG: riboflavin synthase [bacterium]
MFTGIVEEVGRVRRVAPHGGGLRLEIEAERVLERLRRGDSIAVDGVCQTVVDIDAAGFAVIAVAPTLAVTTLGSFGPGRRVNLERALALGDRLGGHIVQGHVDGLGTVLALEPKGEHVILDVRLPDAVAEVSVPRGSICVNGVSLTIQELPAPDVARIALVPYTWDHTALRDLRPGDAVNLEGDMIGKFVVHYLSRTARAGAA